MRDLEGTVSIVTGAGRGFGRATALALAQRGSKLVLASRNAQELGVTVELLMRETGRPPLAVPTDVSDRDDVVALKAESERAFGPADILVNAAAVHGPVAPITTTDLDDWLRTLAINTAGPLMTCHAFVGDMIAKGWGRVINVSSSSTFMEPDAVSSAYATSKVALNQLTRHLAAELEGTGVTANAIHPGSLKTAMWLDIRNKARDKPNADRLTDWTDRVDETGGDPLDKGVEVVLRLIDDEGDAINGRFCWPQNAMEKPVETW
jgi:NAD(P)-dependent dehydrogenase (short-subunit alcohol dehydrogenase family)